MTLILKQYGIALKRVEEKDIELIRQWRNHPSIRKWMGYQKIISKNQQIKWFKSINNKYNYYFLILIKDKPIGVINCKNVNIKEEHGEGGIFIWDKTYVNTPYPVMASIILLNIIFNVLNIGNKSFIRILPENKRAINYNKKLGYILIPGQEKIKNQWYVLVKEDFNKNFKKIENSLKLFSESDGKLSVCGTENSNNLDKINLLLKRKI